MINNKCPCEECISLAICRHKEYKNLFHNCSIINDHIRAHRDPEYRNAERIYELERILNPTNWAYILDKKYACDNPLVFHKSYEPGSNEPILYVEYKLRGEYED